MPISKYVDFICGKIMSIQLLFMDLSLSIRENFFLVNLKKLPVKGKKKKEKKIKESFWLNYGGFWLELKNKKKKGLLD